MAEYKSIHTGGEIDEAVSKALNLEDTTGLSSDKIMSQKAVTDKFNGLETAKEQVTYIWLDLC